MTILSTVSGVSDRAFRNAVKAKLRDPTRSIRLLDFLTYKERVVLFYHDYGLPDYESWLEAQNNV